MALADDAKADGLPDEVVAEIEGGQEGGEDQQQDAPVTLKLSRRKKEQEERELRLKAAEDRAAAAERQIQEISSRASSETAHLRGTLEQMQRQWTTAQQQNAPRQAAEEPIERRIATELKAAETALGASDLREYHEHMGRVMDMKAEAQARAIIAAQPRAAAPPAAAPQKPAWVTAIEFQYPDVLSHPRGQQTVGIVDQLLTNETWGPERLHKAFQRSRAELGLKPAAAPATNGQRGLYGSVSSSATGNGRAASGGGEERVTIPKNYLAVGRRSGMTDAQYARAYRDSNPDE